MKSTHSSGGNFQTIEFLDSLWFQTFWPWCCFLIFDVNRLLFSSSLSHIPFKLVVQILLSGIGWTGILLGKKYAFELKSQSQSLLNYRLYEPLRQRPKLSATFVCCHHILNLHLFFFTSNTTKEMLLTFKTDKLSLFCVKKLSPVRSMAHTISLWCSKNFFSFVLQGVSLCNNICIPWMLILLTFILFKYIVWLPILWNDTAATESYKKFLKFTDTYCFLSKSV